VKPDDRKQEDSKKQSEKSSGQQQQQSGAGNQYGEGNYAATRQYNEGMKEHVEHHDIEKEARDAAPRSDAEAREMEDAERAGRSRAKGSSSPDVPEDQDDVTQ
jgi:hypothetical protein